MIFFFQNIFGVKLSFGGRMMRGWREGQLVKNTKKRVLANTQSSSECYNLIRNRKVNKSI